MDEAAHIAFLIERRDYHRNSHHASVVVPV
jgi:hypothetical protein